jgi:cellulose biosynthesis protein BcsQ
MAVLTFKKATREQLYGRVALLGPAGSGKSYTALRLAFTLAGDGRVAAIDTEHRSLSKYVGEAPDGIPWDFDVLELNSFSPDNYIAGIHAAEQAGYSVLTIDSLSHAWAGKDGILEFVDEVARRAAVRRGGTPNNYTAWRDATPKHNDLVEAMLAAKIHLIVTMRVKMDYVQEKDENGKNVVRKIGLQPVQRDGLEYEFDLIGDMSMDTSSNGANTLIVGKTRCSALRGKMFDNPGREMALILKKWLDVGERSDDGERATGAVTAPQSTTEPVTTTPAPQLGTTATTQGMTGDGGGNATATSQRPYNPVTVRERVQSLAAKGATVLADNNGRGLCVGVIEGLFTDADRAMRAAKRHTLSAYLLGKESSKDWTAGEVLALLKWMCVNGDAKNVNENAPLEAERIVLQYEAEHGQQPLAGV